jgi:hypothetical protein
MQGLVRRIYKVLVLRVWRWWGGLASANTSFEYGVNTLHESGAQKMKKEIHHENFIAIIAYLPSLQ